MSPSKKANKLGTANESESAQETVEPPSVRSLRVSSSDGGTLAGQVDQSSDLTTNAPIQNQKGSSFLTNFLRLLALFSVIGITVFVFLIRDRVEQFAVLGYPGIFLIALLANATVLLPAPGVAVIYAMGSIFNPLVVGLVAGTGAALGELSGYIAGYTGQAVIHREDVYERIKPWVEKYGGWAILVLSAIPNPFFDIAGIAAGIVKMPITTFLAFTWVGQVIKMTIFALAGHYSITWLTQFIE